MKRRDFLQGTLSLGTAGLINIGTGSISGKDDLTELIASDVLCSDATDVKMTSDITERISMMRAIMKSSRNEVANFLNDIRELVREIYTFEGDRKYEMIFANQLMIHATLDAIDRVFLYATTDMYNIFPDDLLDFDVDGEEIEERLHRN